MVTPKMCSSFCYTLILSALILFGSIEGPCFGKATDLIVWKVSKKADMKEFQLFKSDTEGAAVCNAVQLKEFEKTFCSQYAKDCHLLENFVKERLADCKVKHKLTEMECRSVFLYTTSFHIEYNKDLLKGNFKKYSCLTAHIYNAIEKMKHNLKPKLTTYRGLKGIISELTGSFYFKTFTSTTPIKGLAEGFSENGKNEGTILHIEIDTPISAAFISDMSYYRTEREILISPFVRFEFVKKEGNVITLKTA